MNHLLFLSTKLMTTPHVSLRPHLHGPTFPPTLRAIPLRPTTTIATKSPPLSSRTLLRLHSPAFSTTSSSTSRRRRRTLSPLVESTTTTTSTTHTASCTIDYQRWGFINKVYGLVATQLLAVVAVSATLLLNPSWAQFIFLNPLFRGLTDALLAMLFWKPKHPLNLISFGAFTLATSLMTGTYCALEDGIAKIILPAVGITAAAVSSLTGYTFWAAERGRDFTFLEPMLFPCLAAFTAASLLHVFFPRVFSPSPLIWSGIGATLFSANIVLDTCRIIKSFGDDEYLVAAFTLYVDVINLFLCSAKILSVRGGNKKSSST